MILKDIQGRQMIQVLMRQGPPRNIQYMTYYFVY